MPTFNRGHGPLKVRPNHRNPKAIPSVSDRKTLKTPGVVKLRESPSTAGGGYLTLTVFLKSAGA